jgi:hypothetical protein
MPNGERHAPMAVDLRGCIYRHAHRLGEALALVLAGAAAVVHAVDEPGPLPGLDRDQRGHRDALVAAAGHPQAVDQVCGPPGKVTSTAPCFPRPAPAWKIATAARWGTI